MFLFPGARNTHAWIGWGPPAYLVLQGWPTSHIRAWRAHTWMSWIWKCDVPYSTITFCFLHGGSLRHTCSDRVKSNMVACFVITLHFTLKGFDMEHIRWNRVGSDKLLCSRRIAFSFAEGLEHPCLNITGWSLALHPALQECGVFQRVDLKHTWSLGVGSNISCCLAAVFWFPLGKGGSKRTCLIANACAPWAFKHTYTHVQLGKVQHSIMLSESILLLHRGLQAHMLRWDKV